MQRKPTYLAASLIAASVAGLGLFGSYLSRHLTRETTVESVATGKVGVGQAVFLRRVAVSLEKVIAAPELHARDPKGERSYRYMIVSDPGGSRKLVALVWRTHFPNSTDVPGAFLAEVRGTLRRTSEAQKTLLVEGFAERIGGPQEATVYLDEMSFDPVADGAVAAAVAAGAGLIVGIFQLLGRLKPAPAPPPLIQAQVKSGPRARPATAGEKSWSCSACGAESTLASKTCSACKAPAEAEYYVAGNLPFEGFDRFVPLLTRVLGVSEYQATQPLARVHTPIPYQHLEAFHAKGPGANAPMRLAARGIPSLVTARALAADLKEKGIETIVVGSDELKHPIFPRKATALQFDDGQVTFVFELGAERDERVIPWKRISLILFSAAMPLRGTMTIAKDVRDGAPPDPSGYLVDLYEQGNPEGIRIAAHSFYRWEFLKPGGSDRPADHFGKLMELLEEHATEADIHYVTGAYRGPKSEWRMNFLSRFSYLVGEKAGWARREGPPKLEGYEILEKVGEGGMGSVYRARQKKLGRMVAIKVIAAHLAAQPRFASRFQAEARAVAALAHPNIVQIIDLTESAGRHFMVMEFVEGTSLQRMIKERGRIPEEQALRIGLQVANALEHAAERGITHRDVKPDNIFVTSEGDAKLGDWGLAKDQEQDLGLTDTGTALGTPYYMSPEQARGSRDLDVRADLYSLGATLFHAITGWPPFRGGSPAEVIAKHLSTPAPDARSLTPGISDDTAILLQRLMAKKREDRVDDGAEAVRLLEAALEALEHELVLT